MNQDQGPTAERTTVGGALLALTLGVALLAVAAEAILRFVMPNWREFYSGRFIELAQVPGLPPFAIGRPGFDGWFSQNNGDFRVRVRINERGLRNDEPAAAADGRVWVIGDSMAFGWGVERNAMYTQTLADRLGVATYNVASPGTDVCGYEGLYRRMPADVRPRAVVVGLVLENDLRAYDCAAAARAATSAAEVDENIDWATVKMWATGNLALYNFFAVAVKRVALVERALKTVGLIAREHVVHQQFDPADRDRVVAGTAEALLQLKEAIGPGVPFVVLVAPARFEVRDGDPFFRDLREAMLAALAALDLEAVDPLPGFQAAGFAPTHFAHDGHWSPLGHRIAGEALATHFRDRHPLREPPS